MVLKRRMDLSLFFPAPAVGPSRAALRVKNRPTCRSQGSSRRSGRFPALPYPPLKGGVSRFRFPGGPMAGKGKRQVEWKGMF
jgi:hypothetical protein